MSEAVAVADDGQVKNARGPVLADFKGWLSPMLVKELRQGMRTRVFVMAFILLQAAMIMVMLAAAGSSSPGRSSFGFWIVLAAVLLIAMPLRGFSSLSGEMRMRTMDLLVLTRLSSFRIAFGKWAALFCQTLLLAIALLPYVVMRYFLGGVDIANEVVVLILLTLLSGGLTACTVGFSAHQSVLLRGAVAVGIAFLGIMMIGNGLQFMFFRGSLSLVAVEGFWWFILAAVLFLGFVSYYLLDMGATQFAPVAENHATRKRIGALCFAGVFFLAAWASDVPNVPDMLFFLLIPVMLVVVVDAITEHPAPVPSVYVPFVQRGKLGRLAGRFFYPGWHSGLLFFLIVLLVMLLFVVAFDLERLFDGDEALGATLALLGSILFPVVIIRLFFRQHPSPFALYILIQCVTIPLVLILSGIDDGEGMLWVVCPIPFVQVAMSAHWEYDLSYGLPLLFLVIYFITLLVLSAKDFSHVRALEAEARRTVEAQRTIADS